MTRITFDTRDLTWRTVTLAVLKGNYLAMLEQESGDATLNKPLTLLEQAIRLLQDDQLLPDPLPPRPKEPQEARADA